MGRFSCGGIDSALAQHNDHWKQFWKLRNFKLFGLAHKQYFQTIHREEVRARVSTDWCASSTMTIREEPMTCFTPPKKMQQMIRCGLFVLFLLPSVFLLHAFRRRKAVAKYKLPPGPTPLPLIGSLHQLGDLPHLSLHRLSQKYGPLMLIYLGQVPTVIISRAKAASEVLRNQEHLFCNRKPLTATERFSYGGIDIAFAPHDDHWKHLRKLSNSGVFGPPRAVISISAARRRALVSTIQRGSSTETVGEEVTVNLSEMLLCFFNNLIFRKVFESMSADGSATSPRIRVYLGTS
ncbi:hypothetical protein HPP92_028150 [Vanilla planifolia]|uniref:Cytochrome P450 n=1 Tax=Vanilla planifolia TaxID=51239 RepID=A0A835P6K9_VANPL|nr:hypothetical protein HPP92_028150 [Vanilla planifolia]